MDSELNRNLWMLKSWMGMNAIGVALYILYLLQVNEVDGKMISVPVVVYYIMRVFLGVARQRQRLCNRLGQNLSSTKMSQILSSVS